MYDEYVDCCDDDICVMLLSCVMVFGFMIMVFIGAYVLFIVKGTNSVIVLNCAIVFINVTVLIIVMGTNGAMV
jgi:hypothetical protein